MSELRYAPGTPREPCIAGANASSLRASMHALYTESLVGSVLATLPAEVRDEFVHCLATGWLRNTTMDAVVAGLGEQLGRTSDSIYDELMRHGGQRWFKLMWRMMLGLVGDEALVSRAGLIYSRTRNTGEMTGRVVGPGRAELSLTSWPGVPERPARNFALGIEMILAASGRAEARVRHERTADGARFHVSWRSR